MRIFECIYTSVADSIPQFERPILAARGIDIGVGGVFYLLYKNIKEYDKKKVRSWLTSVLIVKEAKFTCKICKSTINTDNIEVLVKCYCLLYHTVLLPL